MAGLRNKIVSMKRLRKRVQWKLFAKEVSEEMLIGNLADSGHVSAGDIVMVHSSLSSIGSVTGGPQTVCHAFQKVLTETGTLLMPAYHQPEPIRKIIEKGTIVDLRTAESTVGKLTNTFRTLTGVRRSSHPFSSVCAWGRYSLEMTSGHDKSPYICGPGSPFLQLVERSGKYMGIGIDIHVVALYHVLEDNWASFPVKVHDPSPFTVRYIDASGRSVERELIFFDPVVAKTRIDHKGGEWIRKWLTNHMLSEGILHEFKFGHSLVWVVDAAEFYTELKRLAMKDITIYTTEAEFLAL